MNHVVLLGDSIFDNAAYVGQPKGTPLVNWLQQEVPTGWRVSLRALDGATTHNILDQLSLLPPSASHLVVSVGGNDALFHKSFLMERVSSTAAAVHRLSEIRREFHADYERMIVAVRSHGKPTALCTIYEPRYPDPIEQELAATALAIFNDVIIRLAFEHGLPLVDLRLICRDDSDYANPIEPSSSGGARIARAIAGMLTRHSFETLGTQVYC
jgi:lysophospholipase L1-like esterase